MTATVYPGLLDSVALAELRERIEKLERLLGSLKADHVAAQRAGETLLDALVIDSCGVTAGASTVNPSSTPPIVDEPGASREPPLAGRGQPAVSSPIHDAIGKMHDKGCSWRAGTGQCDCLTWGEGVFTCARCLTTSAPHEGCRCGSNAERPFFQVGDRCCVHTGGDPCVKPGTVVRQESDGRWFVQLDRAGALKATEDEMVLLPSEWR